MRFAVLVFETRALEKGDRDLRFLNMLAGLMALSLLGSVLAILGLLIDAAGSATEFDEAKRNLGNRRLNEKNRLELFGVLNELSSDDSGSLDTDLARFGIELVTRMRFSGGTEPRSSGLSTRYIAPTSGFALL